LPTAETELGRVLHANELKRLPFPWRRGSSGMLLRKLELNP